MPPSRSAIGNAILDQVNADLVGPENGRRAHDWAIITGRS